MRTWLQDDGDGSEDSSPFGAIVGPYVSHNLIDRLHFVLAAWNPSRHTTGARVTMPEYRQACYAWLLRRARCLARRSAASCSHADGAKKTRVCPEFASSGFSARAGLPGSLGSGSLGVMSAGTQLGPHPKRWVRGKWARLVKRESSSRVGQRSRLLDLGADIGRTWSMRRFPAEGSSLEVARIVGGIRPMRQVRASLKPASRCLQRGRCRVDAPAADQQLINSPRVRVPVEWIRAVVPENHEVGVSARASLRSVVVIIEVVGPVRHVVGPQADLTEVSFLITLLGPSNDGGVGCCQHVGSSCHQHRSAGPRAS